MHPEVQKRDKKQASSTLAEPDSGHHGHQLHDELRGMTFDEGAAALAPVQMEEGKTAAPPVTGPPKPFTAAVVQHTPGQYNDSGGRSQDELIIQGGKNKGVTLNTKVICDGVNGRVVEVYQTRSRVVFYEMLLKTPAVEVRIGETWSKAQEDAMRQKRDQDASKRSDKEVYTDEHKTRRK